MTIFMVMFLFVVYFYSPLLFHPGTYIMGDKGDSIKNYFSYAWHVQNDTSFVNYSGTNYPFGEQHAYTDGNPLLSDLVKALPFLKGQAIAIFNLSLLFSIIVTALLVFNILVRLKVQHGFAIIAAVGIAMLSPQTGRLPGHFTLSYSFFIPLVIYLLLLFESGERRAKYSWLLCLTVLCSFFVHPYMGMILASMVFLYHIARLIFSFSSPYKERWPKAGGVLFLQAGFPVVFYFVFLKLTDTHTNRTSHPYGFFYFIARFESVFVSSLPPFRHMLSQIIKIRGQNWEGLAYVGISSLFALLCVPVLLYVKRGRIKEYFATNKSTFAMFLLLCSSLILLLFSMGYPFRWGMEGLADAIPFVKQFRSPGRFAWPFYFVITIFSTIVLAKYFLPKINSYLRMVLVSAILLLYTVEAVPFHQQVKERGFVRNCFDKELLDDEMKLVCAAIAKTGPQAIIPLPFFHVGTDYFSFNGTDKIKTASFISAFQDNIPLFADCTDRTSLDEAKLSVQLMGSDLITKEMGKYINDKRPFCILYSKESIQNWEENILDKGKTILETPNFIVKKVSSADLLSDEKLTFKKKAVQLEVQGLFKNSIYLTDSSFVFSGYENKANTLTGDVSASVVLMETQAALFEKEKEYEVSFWYGLKNEDELSNFLIVEQVRNNIPDTIARTSCSAMPDVLDNKVRMAVRFKISDAAGKIRISLSGNKEYKGSFELDNLLIRRKDVGVYQKKLAWGRRGEIYWFNNYPLE